ncbi:hypothetical protein [Niveibacterium terrae]|uniref:hypothetical protein n=1 Tax=Niveibacterium terrae TaxID=3373598 RepID=UPI003A915D3B
MLIGYKRFCRSGVLTLLLGLGALLVTPLSAAASNPDPLLMAPSPDANYSLGSWMLIPQPLPIVKAELESGFAKNGWRGFQWRDDSAPLLAMEFYWGEVSLLHRPDIQKALSARAGERASPVFDRALAAGAISAEERAVYEQSIREQLGYDKETLQSQPFFAQRIARWSFFREKGWAKKTEKVTGLIMDVSPMLARSPMTLVWFAGWNTVTSTRFEWASCMTGVTCFLAPHFAKQADSKKYLDPKLLAYLEASAKKMQALPDEAAEPMLQGYRFAYRENNMFPGQKLLSESKAAPVRLSGSELPADLAPSELNDKRWNMVALPDGSVLISGNRVHRLVRETGQVRRIASLAELVSAQDLKVDQSGRVWSYSEAGEAGSHFMAWNPKTGATRSYPLPARISGRGRGVEWIVVPGQAIAFRNHDDLYTLEANGQWMHSVWNSRLRTEVSDSLDHVMPWLARTSDIGPHFGDGLFWQADRDVYGVDPRTAHVVSSLRIPSAKLVFGCHGAGWGLVLDRAYKAGVARIFDLKSGRLRFDVETSLANDTSSFARSAHGRLLALSSRSSNSVQVLDMHNEQPLAVLLAHEGYAIQATAFSWKGDQLWMYAKGRAGQAPRMMVWDVPASAIDPAQGAQLPDQLRCDYSEACR